MLSFVFVGPSIHFQLLKTYVFWMVYIFKCKKFLEFKENLDGSINA